MIKWNVTYIRKDGLRTLLGPAQGRFMHETKEEASELLEALVRDEKRLLIVCGDQARGTFRVDAFKCHETGDPVGIFVS